ncbi:MAG: TIGR04086 family membrane protein [Candidatus Bathyarchaeota archaeon]|nr:TIGR04086 family membrane protein [Candidatus Bathyarchaeota archaeon]
MSQKMFKEHPKIIEYVQGASIANAPTFLLFIILSFVDPDLESLVHSMQFFNYSLSILSILAFILLVVSTLIAGFLVAGRVTSRYVRTGTYTGAFSYLMFLIYKLFFYPSGMLPESWMFLVFLIGGGLGGLLKRYLS